MTLPTEDQLGRELYESAAGNAQSRGYVFGAGADDDIRRLADAAAGKILQEAAADANPRGALPQMRQEAERAFARVVDEMIRTRASVYGAGVRADSLIGEETLRKALAGLCPLWPIC